MKIAILSDIHDNVWNLQRALEASRDCDALLCCGDLCSPFIVNMMADGFPGPIHVVFGNNDGDQYRMTQNASMSGDRVKLYGEFATLSPEQAGMRVAINHYPRLAKALASSGDFDLVCFGHDHTLSVDVRRDGCSLINPGAVMGYDPLSGRVIHSTIVLLDTETLEGGVFSVTSRPGSLMWKIGPDTGVITLDRVVASQ